MQLHGKQIKPATIPNSALNLVDPTLPLHPVTLQYLQNTLAGYDTRPSARVATTANITLSGTQTIDGIVLNVGDSVLVKNQTTASANGIYIVASGSWTRRSDANSSTNVTPGLALYVEEGTANGGKMWQLTTTGTIVIGTTNLSFSVVASNYYATPTPSNKNMVASITAIDNDVASTTGMVATPAQGSYVEVEVNGFGVVVGNASKVADCYFSGDSGTTPRAWNAIVAGDKLYWVGSVAGYQLDGNDRITFKYAV